MPAVTTTIRVTQDGLKSLFTEKGAEIAKDDDKEAQVVTVDLTKYRVVFFHSEEPCDGFNQYDEPYDRVQLVKEVR